MHSFLTLLSLTLVLLSLCVAGLAVRILLKKGGRFPETHVGRNKHMKKLGITCAQN